MLVEIAPVLQIKFEAPVAVSVVEAPAQITDCDAVMLTLGNAFTIIVFEADAEHPLALVPVTE